MANLILTLSDHALDRLKIQAERAGMDVEEWATQQLGMAEEAMPFGSSDSGPAEALRRLARYDKAGDFVDGDAALDAFVAKVEARAAARG